MTLRDLKRHISEETMGAGVPESREEDFPMVCTCQKGAAVRIEGAWGTDGMAGIAEGVKPPGFGPAGHQALEENRLRS